MYEKAVVNSNISSFLSESWNKLSSSVKHIWRYLKEETEVEELPV